MSVLANAVLAAEEGGHVVTELPFSPIVYGIIVFALFAVMAGITFAFRDVANRHSEKAEAFAREHGEDAPRH